MELRKLNRRRFQVKSLEAIFKNLVSSDEETIYMTYLYSRYKKKEGRKECNVEVKISSFSYQIRSYNL